MIKVTLFSIIICQKLSHVDDKGAIAAMNTFLPFSLFIDVYKMNSVNSKVH
jgi:hypothetical protein